MRGQRYEHEEKNQIFHKNRQYYKFCMYGFLKNLRFFEPFLIVSTPSTLERGLSLRVQIGTLYAGEVR